MRQDPVLLAWPVLSAAAIDPIKKFLVSESRRSIPIVLSSRGSRRPARTTAKMQPTRALLKRSVWKGKLPKRATMLPPCAHARSRTDATPSQGHTSSRTSRHLTHSLEMLPSPMMQTKPLYTRSLTNKRQPPPRQTPARQIHAPNPHAGPLRHHPPQLRGHEL